MGDAARLGALAVSAETIRLRDQWGNEHRATVQDEGRVRIGDSELVIATNGDGSVRIEGGRNTRAWSVVAADLRWVFINGDVFTF